ncbi:MAG: PAS domain-containing protein, partial [Chitinophagaceae bacterium]|nr:PAS domain-containing protein [Chitinophagaceae bacterium]
MKGHIFEDIINDIEDYALFLLNAEGKVVSWNRGAERIKGYKEHEVTGKSFEIFYTEEDRQAGLPQRLLEEARTNGRVQTEGWRVAKDDDRFWAFVVITAVKDADGKVIGFVKITRDLSERMAAEKAISDYETDIRELALKSQRLKNIYQIFQSEVTDYAIIMLDKNGMIVDWNPGARKIKGYE